MKGICKMAEYERTAGCRPVYACTNDMNRFSVAMGYVPWQYWHTVYDLEKALSCGTIFPELDKPFRGVRGGCR